MRFITDQQGFPAMPAQLQAGAWNAAFLAEPYITAAGEKYGDRVLADLDQGSAVNFPIDGYVATTAWAQQNPKAAAAFVRAIQAGQLLADTDPAEVKAAIAKYDNLGSLVTTAMALSGYPTGPVNKERIQRVAAAMLEFGILARESRRGRAGHPGRVHGRPRFLKQPSARVRAVHQQRIARLRRDPDIRCGRPGSVA